MIKKNIDFDLRKLSGKWLSVSLAAAMSGFLLALITWRTFDIEVLPPQREPIEIEVTEIPPTEQVQTAPPPERPSIPIESEDEDIPDDITITSTTIDFDEEPIDIPVMEEEEIPDFVAYDKPPEPVKKAVPEYPEIARKAGIEGDVWLKVGVDTSGNVIPSKIKVIKNTTGNSGCVEAAIEAAKSYKFSPAYQRDKPVRVWVSLPFKFRLNK